MGSFDAGGSAFESEIWCTMYSAVAERTREIATIRALGFGEGSVVLSFVIESLLVALAGESGSRS